MKNRLAHIKPTGVICLGYFITYARTLWSSKNLALLYTDTVSSRLFVFCLHLPTFSLSAPENHHLNQGLSTSLLPFALLSTISVAPSFHREPGWSSRYSNWLQDGQLRGQSSSAGRGKIFLLSVSSTSGLGPTQPQIQMGSGGPFSRGKVVGQ
jgi:hypothetical protein